MSKMNICKNEENWTCRNIEVVVDNPLKYGILFMLLGDNHPNNENMIDSKKYHIFYDKKGHLSYAIFKIFCIIS